MHYASSGSGAPDPEFLRRMSPPENEIPVPVPLNTLLFRTGDVALALLGLQVYSTGLTFDIAIRARAAAAGRRPLGELLWGRSPAGSAFLLGLELADGRRITNTQRPFPAPEDGDGFVFHHAGGSGGDLAADQSWWLSPLPPDGPLRVVVRCEELGITDTSTELDGELIGRAVAQVVELWPWEPAPDQVPPWEQPPDVPGDSWFSGGAQGSKR
jgi:hypothetical protein